jgi:hypothetical protein
MDHVLLQFFRVEQGSAKVTEGIKDQGRITKFQGSKDAGENVSIKKEKGLDI